MDLLLAGATNACEVEKFAAFDNWQIISQKQYKTGAYFVLRDAMLAWYILSSWVYMCVTSRHYQNGYAWDHTNNA